MKLPSFVFLLIATFDFTLQAPHAAAQLLESSAFELMPKNLPLNERLILAQGGKLTPSEAAKRARDQYGGKVVGSPRCRSTDSGTVCTVKLDINGRIKTVTIRG